MNDDQRHILLRLLKTYCGNVVEEAGNQRLKETVEAGIEKIHFAWFGEPRLDAPHYYRVWGPTFILELDNTQSDPQGNPANHIHSSWRSPTSDFGMGKSR